MTKTSAKDQLGRYVDFAVTDKDKDFYITRTAYLKETLYFRPHETQ